MARRPKGLRPGEVLGLPPPRKGGPRLRVYHRHGCVRCRAVYADACELPYENGHCRDCEGSAHGRPVWERNLDPVACCAENSRLVGREDIERYALGGPGPWFICRVCARTSPFDPKKE